MEWIRIATDSSTATGEEDSGLVEGRTRKWKAPSRLALWGESRGEQGRRQIERKFRRGNLGDSRRWQRKKKTWVSQWKMGDGIKVWFGGFLELEKDVLQGDRKRTLAFSLPLAPLHSLCCSRVTDATILTPALETRCHTRTPTVSTCQKLNRATKSHDIYMAVVSPPDIISFDEYFWYFIAGAGKIHSGISTCSSSRIYLALNPRAKLFSAYLRGGRVKKHFLVLRFTRKKKGKSVQVCNVRPYHYSVINEWNKKLVTAWSVEHSTQNYCFRKNPFNAKYSLTHLNWLFFLIPLSCPLLCPRNQEFFTLKVWKFKKSCFKCVKTFYRAFYFFFLHKVILRFYFVTV